jgi:hypothetical protein
MSSIEERLVRDIAAVTRGVVVTDSDLRDAQAAVAERIGNVRQQDRRRSAVAVAAAAAAVVVLLLGLAAYLTIGGDDKAAPPAGPGPSSTPSIDNHASFLTGNAPTPDLIEGIWRLDNGGVLMRFASPDLVSWDRGGRLFEDPSVQGRYTIDGDTITITVDGGPAGCGGQHIVMRASVPERGAMRFVFTEPGEGPCNGAKDERWVMEQVLPPGPVFTDFHFAGVRGWQLLRDPTRLHGTWAAVGGGYALELAPNGEYHIAAGRGLGDDRIPDHTDQPAGLGRVHRERPARPGRRRVRRRRHQRDPLDGAGEHLRCRLGGGELVPDPAGPQLTG